LPPVRSAGSNTCAIAVLCSPRWNSTWPRASGLPTVTSVTLSIARPGRPATRICTCSVARYENFAHWKTPERSETALEVSRQSLYVSSPETDAWARTTPRGASGGTAPRAVHEYGDHSHVPPDCRG